MGSTKQHFYFRTGTKLVQGNGKPLEFDSKADAENYAKEANEHTTANVDYSCERKKNRNPALFGKEHLNRNWMQRSMKK